MKHIVSEYKKEMNNYLFSAGFNSFQCMGNDTMQQVIKHLSSYELNKAGTVSEKKYMII